MSALSANRRGFEAGWTTVSFLFISVVSLASAIATQSNLLFWAFGLTMGVLATSVLLSWLMMRHVTVERALPDHAVAGEMVVIRYTVRNTGRWLPVFGLVIEERGEVAGRDWLGRARVVRDSGWHGTPTGWALHVGPGQTVTVDAAAWPGRRGVLRLGPVVAWTSFPLGILRRVAVFHAPTQTLIYPHLFRVNRTILNRVARPGFFGEQRVNRPGGVEDFYGLREYRAGDSPKHIDWRRTARLGEIVTRELTRSSPPRMIVHLDLAGRAATPRREPDAPPPPTLGESFARFLGRPLPPPPRPATLPPDELERAISLAASLVCDAHSRGYRVGLSASGAPLKAFRSANNPAHLTRILRALATLADLESPDALPQDHASADAPRPAEPPSVIVKPGNSDRGTLAPNAPVTLLGSDDLESIVTEPEGGSALLLRSALRRAGPTTPAKGAAR